MKATLGICLVLAGCAANDPGTNVSVSTTNHGVTPRAVQLVIHDADGVQVDVVDAPDGTASLAVPDGGAVTAFDISDPTYMTTWLGVHLGDELSDGREAEPAVAFTGASSGTSHTFELANAADIRFARARVDMLTDGHVGKGGEATVVDPMSQPTTTVTYEAGAAGFASAVLYDAGPTGPNVPSTWIYDDATDLGDTFTIDRNDALPFVVDAFATVATDRSVSVGWTASAPLAGEVQAGRVMLFWHNGDSTVGAYHTWSIRFAYAGDTMLLPRIDGELAARLPDASTGDLFIFAEPILVDFASPDDADAFRRDSKIIGNAPVGDVRDMFFAGQLGIRRLTLDTPF